jgi:hypothetical protein
MCKLTFEHLLCMNYTVYEASLSDCYVHSSATCYGIRKCHSVFYIASLKVNFFDLGDLGGTKVSLTLKLYFRN